ncbi:hypothetical protein EON65_55020, partial [archaeon]
MFRSFWDRDECYKMLTNFVERFRAGHSLVDFRKIPHPAPPAPISTPLASPNPRTASDPPAPASPE